MGSFPVKQRIRLRIRFANRFFAFQGAAGLLKGDLSIVVASFSTSTNASTPTGMTPRLRFVEKGGQRCK
jgi:hypothetical protein